MFEFGWREGFILSWRRDPRGILYWSHLCVFNVIDFIYLWSSCIDVGVAFMCFKTFNGIGLVVFVCLSAWLCYILGPFILLIFCSVTFNHISCMYIVSSDYMKNIHQERDSVVLVNCVEYLGIVNMRKYVNRSVYSFRLKALKICWFHTLYHNEMSRLMLKATKWSVRPSKTQISSMKKAWVLSDPMSAQRRLWSDAQADLSFRWVHSRFVGFVVRRLKLPKNPRRNTVYMQKDYLQYWIVTGWCCYVLLVTESFNLCISAACMNCQNDCMLPLYQSAFHFWKLCQIYIQWSFTELRIKFCWI